MIPNIPPLDMTNYPMINKPQAQGINPLNQLEAQSSTIMKNTTNIQITRDETCIQCGWEFRDTTYSLSEAGAHQVQKFDPCCINSCCWWPYKRCLSCRYTLPPHISSKHVHPDGIQVLFPSKNQGVVFISGVSVGTFEYQRPGNCWSFYIFRQPKVIITKSVTNEQLILRPNDNCLLGCVEIHCGCFVKEKAMYVEKQGRTKEGRYTRSCARAILNTFCCNPHFYENLSLDVQDFIQNDSEKFLVYAAFIFYQENYKFNCLSFKQISTEICNNCCCCFIMQ